MVSKEKLNEFIAKCVSTGRYVEVGLNLPHTSIMEIENILERCGDKTASSKIRKIVKGLGL